MLMFLCYCGGIKHCSIIGINNITNFIDIFITIMTIAITTDKTMLNASIGEITINSGMPMLVMGILLTGLVVAEALLEMVTVITITLIVTVYTLLYFLSPFAFLCFILFLVYGRPARLTHGGLLWQPPESHG